MNALQQGIGLYDVVALGISAAVGVSIFSVVAPATGTAGPGVLVALLLALAPMLVFAILYAFLSSADPRSGSSFHWPAQYVHPYVGFIVCWLRILGSAGALYVMGSIFAAYLATIIPVPQKGAALAVLTAIFLINIRSVHHVGRTATILTLLKLIVLAGFIGVGLTQIEPRHFTPVLPHGVTGVFAALPLLVGLFAGIETATEAGEEVRNGRSAIGLGLAIATVVSSLLYLGVTLVTIGVLGPDATAQSQAPLADAAAIFGPFWSSPALVIAALISIAAAMNALFLMFSRFLFAMGTSGAISPALGRIHPTWGTPWLAIVVVYVATLISFAMPDDLVFLFLAVNIPTILKYGANCLSSLGLLRRRPDLHEGASFRLRPGTIRCWAYAGLACTLVLLASGLEADWRPYTLLAGWGALGTLYWMLTARRRAATVPPVAALVPGDA